ncbi:MAG: hypothetical protein NVS3B20_08380 [Polyangiales bacterium]
MIRRHTLAIAIAPLVSVAALVALVALLATACASTPAPAPRMCAPPAARRPTPGLGMCAGSPRYADVSLNDAAVTVEGIGDAGDSSAEALVRARTGK